MDDARALLQANCDKLLDQYVSNIADVHALQATFIDDILPNVADELQMDAGLSEWAEDWLRDTSSIFQILRRNKFTRSFAIEAIRKTLIWRLSALQPTPGGATVPLARVLPDDVRDPLGRPVIVLKVVSCDVSPDSLKPVLIQEVERLRVHLRNLNQHPEVKPTKPVLQYIVILDLAGLSMKKIPIDLITWVLRELIPRFPGMLAAVFMVNYSWAHSGIWGVVKRVLPAQALSRVFFPTQDELLHFFSHPALPAEYGGTLPSSTDLDVLTPSNRTRAPSRHRATSTGRAPRVPSPSRARVSTPKAPSATVLSPTSVLNPFFGYPVTASQGLPPSFHHGRRRKRDLVRTLALLLWMRWRKHITACLWLIALTLSVRLWARAGLLRAPRGIAALQVLWKSGFPW